MPNAKNIDLKIYVLNQICSGDNYFLFSKLKQVAACKCHHPHVRGKPEDAESLIDSFTLSHHIKHSSGNVYINEMRSIHCE